jgi:hypothetical protein
MLPQEQEEILASLYEWLAVHQDIVVSALSLIRDEGVSNYPILILSERGGAEVSRLGVVLPSTGAWSSACTTLERCASAGFILESKVPEFCALYRSRGLGYVCILLLDAKDSRFVFVNLAGIEKNNLLEVE